jgi:hypothetical protein
MVDFRTAPGQYRHWGLVDGPVATLTMDGAEASRPGDAFDRKRV